MPLRKNKRTKPSEPVSSKQDESVRRKVNNRTTAGTGVTGQMRHEMNDRVDKQNSVDLMSYSEAKSRINRGKEKNMLLKFRTGRTKGGKSGTRYAVYSKATTFQQYEALIQLKKAKKGDLFNDLQKGFLSLHVNPEQTAAEAMREDLGEIEELRTRRRRHRGGPQREFDF